MIIRQLHTWDLTPGEASRLQRELRERHFRTAPLDIAAVRRVAGADASYSKVRQEVYAAAIVFSFPEIEQLEVRTATLSTTFPYVPGLLSFREGPAVLEAFAAVEAEPDVVFFDGQGVAHPRGFGIATHMGVLLDKPTVGVAKTMLVGRYEPPGRKRGDRSPLMLDNEEIGAVVRTRDNVEPVFVSVGYRIELEAAVELVLACTHRYRLPEPTRQAHLLANKLKQR